MAAKQATIDLLSDIKAVIAQYPDIKMTVRQVYYRLVAAQKIRNSQCEYNRVKKCLTNARLDGEVSFDAIEDRTRNIHTINHYEHVGGNIWLNRETESMDYKVEDFTRDFAKTIRSLDEYYDLQRWYKQPNAVYVAVEKQALQGLFTTVCDEKQVDLLVCRGYPSITVVKKLATRMRRDTRAGKLVRLIYFGDYDPSGLDIDRNIEERLYEFGALFTMERIAITREQIDEYDIPPAPAKLTDSRTRGMEDRLGEAMQVELDAIDPPDLIDIIGKAIDDHFDQSIYDGVRQDELEERQAQVRKWIDGFIVKKNEGGDRT